MKIGRRWVNALLFSLLLLINIVPSAPILAADVRASQSVTAAESAQELLEQLSVEERIGQLFLIGFDGSNIDQTTQIYQLIEQYHIGGVMLSAGNDNFQPNENLLEDYAQLSQGLQTIEWENSLENTAVSGSESLYVPLYIGIQQNGNGAPDDQILSGLTQVPSQMALGATWNVNSAYQAGSILGEELSALGINLFFGPSLDIYEDSNTWLGTQTFGSDPDWVGKMGQAYIRGLHQGSQNQMAVIAKNFPGTGEADHSPNDDIVTSLKTMDQLNQFDLAPFYDVTGSAVDQASQADGVLISHSRYQALQGAIRATTRPVSLDQDALNTLFSMPAMADWETSGGLVVSDNLASTAVRKFFDPVNLTFDARQVTTSALSAGNDLLYIDGLVSPLNEENFALLVDAIEFFTQKYQEDPVFAEHVDQAVLKTLQTKFELYPEFAFETVLSSDTDLSTLGESSPLVFSMAQEAVTLISPGADDLNSLLPNAPGSSDRIVFISDTLAARQCSRCDLEIEFSERSLQDAVLRLYGPSGSGQVLNNRLSSYSFNQLEEYLNDSRQELEHVVIDDLALADWVVFSFLELDSERSASGALKRLLAEKADLLLGKNVIVFAFGDPTILDATEIANLTAYYAVYSKGGEFVDVAARVLFKELPVSGALPVSFSDIGYDITAITGPDPEQIIPLVVDQETLAELNTVEVIEERPAEADGEETTAATLVPGPPADPTFEVNDLIPLLAGPVVDHNGNIVPNGTPIQFQAILFGDTPGLTRVIDTITENGMARAVFPIQESGLMEIRVVSEPAQLSSVLQIDVPEEGEASVLEMMPETTEGDVQPTLQPTITAQPTNTAVPTIEPTQVPDLPTPQPSAGEWIVAMAIAWVGGVIAFFGLARSTSIKWQARRALLVVILSILSYSYLVVQLPGSTALLDAVGNFWATLIFSLIGGLLGFILGLVWHHEFE